MLVTDGPEGIPLVLRYADATDHGYCVQFAGPGTATPRKPTDDGGACGGPVGGSSWRRFGGDQAGVSGEIVTGHGVVQLYAVHVLGAVRVAVVFSDGTTRPSTLGQDWTAGWLTAEQAALDPVLVGYDTAETEIGRGFALPVLSADCPR